MTAENPYDLCVVGAGLIGSAAARHASQWGRVCVVGPEEPKVSQVLHYKRRKSRYSSP